MALTAGDEIAALGWDEARIVELLRGLNVAMNDELRVIEGLAAVQLHHPLTEGHLGDGLRAYAIVLFAIWWAWMNFTWFATSFDTDDWLYGVLTIVQMGGVLALAAGVEPIFAHGDFTLAVLAYVVMRGAMIAQWLRASHRAGERRAATLTCAVGIGIVQVLWLVMLLLPPAVQSWVLPVLILAEIAVPVVAERRGYMPWHPHHITERYGLFTLILLGESLLASANAIIEALHGDEAELGPLIWISIMALVVTAALWWIYFWPLHHRSITGRLRSSITYGYMHYFIFAAAGAFSAGVEAEIDVLTHHSELDR